MPIPAAAEIVLEGEIMPPDTESRQEGPFGEWPGYYSEYAAHGRPEAAFRVKSILHRNAPIILGAAPLMPAADPFSFGKHIMRAAVIWDELDRQIPGVKGVWTVGDVGPMHMHVVAIEQKYGGHAKQTAMAVGGLYASSYRNKVTIIVDEDVDPSSLSEVMWAVCTRCDARDAVEVIKGCWSATSDPVLTPEKLAKRDLEHSRIVITACKPYYWRNDFPPIIATSRELLAKMKEKWQEVFRD